MAITDSAIQRVRARIEAFDADPKQVEAFKQLASQRAQLRDLAAAIGTFVDGGGLRDFATAYGSPLQSGWVSAREATGTRSVERGRFRAVRWRRAHCS